MVSLLCTMKYKNKHITTNLSEENTCIRLSAVKVIILCRTRIMKVKEQFGIGRFYKYEAKVTIDITEEDVKHLFYSGL